METMEHLKRYQDQFIDMERQQIGYILEQFYHNKLSQNFMREEIRAMMDIISKIFITWDDYQQFMDDHPEDFCWVLKGVTPI